ncbi:AAA family ATPase [Falsiruegeria litorea]|uniref:AAA family ATPase n=1 Tax=Falsiruegeria litorea TaxID=1280831 RepID=UPI001BFDE13A|nr:AAA family ATPase [Falsiruegeria litorea]MBT8167592.1 AAA family ATPase [Falsiruegeria litorea]
MKIKFNKLHLLCKQSDEEVPFGEHVSFFHGEMGAGKSTIAEMINFCLGGKLVKTPAVSSEVLSVKLLLTVGHTEILLERDLRSTTSVVASWKNEDELGRLELPFEAGTEPLYGEDVYNFSDFIFRAMSVPVLKVRTKKDDPDSKLHRVSFRDFWKFCYLDQKHLDSSFFVLEQAIRAEKSKDVLKYVLGLHSDRLNTLQGELGEARQRQRTLREAAEQIHEFLSRFGFSSEAEIDLQLDIVNSTAEPLELERERQLHSPSGKGTVSDFDRKEFERLDKDHQTKSDAVDDILGKLSEQNSLIAEFMSMKFKAARSSLATEILQTSDFNACPSCGTDVSKKTTPDCCKLCKSPLADAPGGFNQQRAVIEQDLDDRIKDLKQSVRRLSRSLDTQKRALEQITQSRQEVQHRIDASRREIESEYIKAARRIESKLGELNERRRFLSRVRKMPAEIEKRRSQADKLSETISKLNRDIADEEARFKSGRINVRTLEANFKKVLMAIHFPGLGASDTISINLRTWLPYIFPDGDSERKWTFDDAGSGGKMVLFKMCFCLAFHLTAAEKKLPIPQVIVIDSPMKNITPDINPDVFEHFYKELYRLLSNELSDWQCVVVDQTFCPFEGFETGVTERKLTKSDPDHPPLIGYYTGH